MCSNKAVFRAAASTVAAVLGAMGSVASAQYYPSSTYETPAAGFTAPATYYNPAIGLTGQTLKTALNDIIDDMTPTTYSGSETKLMILDQDPANSNNVLLVYGHASPNWYSVPKTWSPNTMWNKEHLWPNSYGMDDGGEGYGDLFNLRACQTYVNSTRGNLYFDTASGALPNESDTFIAQKAVEARRSSAAWMPPTVDMGHIARSAFYTDTRFEGQGDDGDTDNFQLTDTVSSITGTNANMGRLRTLLEWNYQHGVTNYERRRNHLIYTNYQFNRNPYIDHPEYVWAVFGGSTNDSQIYAGGSVNASTGVSTPTVELRAMQNATLPTGSVTITKSGLNPTNYDLTATGNVTAAANTFGPGQAFDYGPAQITRTIIVGLSDSTATLGAKIGTITIDNTDITAAANPGQGSGDGNDVITVKGQVVTNRVISASAVSFGKVIINTPVSLNTTLSSPESDDVRTRVTVQGTAVSANGEGVSIPAGAPSTFNGGVTSAHRTLQANFTSVGGKAGSVSFPVVSAETNLSGTQTVLPVSASYSATGVEHAQPSLATTTTQTINFGYVPAGFAVRGASLVINNNPSGSGAANTAALDIDGAVSTGSPLMYTDVAATNPATPLAASSSLTQGAFFTPDTAPGLATATHTIATSDENILGATPLANLVLTTSGRTFTAATFPVSDYLYLLTGETLNTGPFSIGDDVTLNPTGGGSTMNIDAAQSNGDNSTMRTTNGITVNVASDAGSASSAQLAMQAESTSVINLNAAQHLRALTIAGGDVNASADVVTDALTHTAGKLDLKSNKLIVHNGDEAALTAKTAAGRNGGAWNGDGIVTSMTDAAGISALTSLGIASASDVLGIGLAETGTWAGETVTGADTLIRYTWNGDANLSGTIDADDYFAIDSANGSASPRWSDGDFNYSGNVDGDDYFIIDANYGSGGTLIPASPALGAIGAVPEPALGSFLALALLATRRRRVR